MWIEELENGKYKCIERYTDYITGKYKKVSVTIDKNTRGTRKAAESVLLDKIAHNMAVTNKSNSTLGDVINAYLSFQSTEVKQSTFKRNTSVCNSFNTILGANSILSRLTASYIRSSFANTNQNAQTLNERIKRFKALIRWAYKNDYIDDIMWLSKIEPFKDDTPDAAIEEQYLERDDLATLIDGLTIDVWRLLTKFLALSGLRIGEAIALTTNDVIYDTRIIIINKTYDYINDVTTSPKTKSSNRTVFMQDELLDVVQSLDTLMQRRKFLGKARNNNLFLVHEDGRHLQYAAYEKYLQTNAFRILGRTNITPHKLRHTHTSLMAESGVSLDAISRRLGHENSGITKKVYLHITKKMMSYDNAQFEKVSIF